MSAAAQAAAKRRPFRLTAPVPLEDELHQSVADALRYLLPRDAIFNTWELRNAASAIEGARRKKLGALPGWPDCSVWWRSRVVLLELKRSRYGQVSAVQRELHERLEHAGFPVEICCSVDDVLATVSRAGIPLRGRAAA
jgi:hypothetical protein